MEEKQKFQLEGLKWLYEMELLNHPQAINNIKLNIFAASKHIKEVELLIYREKKSMLVQLELSWIGRTFYKREIMADAQSALEALLPSFKFRITDDPEILKLAIKRVQRALTGGTNEITINNDVSTDGERSV